MKNFKNTILTLIVVIGVSACSKLDQEPYNSFSADLAYVTTDDLQNNLMGVYAPFRSSIYYGQNFVLSGELTTDNFVANNWNSNTNGDQHRWEIQSGTYQCRDLWSAIYSVVTRANDLIDNANKVTPKEGQKQEDVAKAIKQSIAEARIARAIAYFDLVRVYAKAYDASTAATDLGVPIVLHNPTDVQDAIQKSNVSRSTIEQVYTQIKSDLQLGINAINELGGNINTTNNNRFSKYIAFAYLSRIHLYRGEYQLSVNFADSTFKNTTYGFETAANFQSIWTTDRSTKEFIWNIGIVPFESGNTALGGYYIADDPTQLPLPDYSPAMTIIQLTNGTVRGSGLCFQPFAIRGGRAATCYLIYKYPGNPEFRSNTYRSNMPHVMRYAEVSLNKAEALYYIDQTAALAELNRLRTARSLAAYPDNTSLLSRIYAERRLELYGEGHRWHDLKRWHLGFTRTANTPQYGTYQTTSANISIPADHYMFTWPIPQEEILNNVGIANQQNPGY